jgi:hypothetical protein
MASKMKVNMGTIWGTIWGQVDNIKDCVDLQGRSQSFVQELTLFTCPHASQGA